MHRRAPGTRRFVCALAYDLNMPEERATAFITAATAAATRARLLEVSAGCQCAAGPVCILGLPSCCHDAAPQTRVQGMGWHGRRMQKNTSA